MSGNAPGPDGDRGAIVNTASAAAFDGQVGQAAYSASKGGVVGLTLPLARDLAGLGIRVNCIAPGLFDTPMWGKGPQGLELKQQLGATVVFPKRLGHPAEFAAMAAALLTNGYANGEVVRMDGAIRLAPR
jgi:NAD(P)-dependent dehydrogenase (short-subunit alcohol dehydrogenase family)